MTMRRFAAVLTLVLLGTTAASAQILDDTWFKVKVKARGTTISSSGGLSSDTIKAEGFMHLTFNDDPEGDPDEVYEVEFFVENNSGEFVQSKASDLPLFRGGNNGLAVISLLFGVQAEGLPGFDIFMIVDDAIAQVRLRLTSEGSLKNARMRGTAGVAQAFPAGTEGSGDVFVGGIRLRAKTIPVSKLPFSPPTML